MDDSSSNDWAERFGKHASTIFITALGLMFAYGYLGHLFFN